MKQPTIPQKCASCAFSAYVTKGRSTDPDIIYCSVLEKRLVARATRKCLSFQPIKTI